MLHCNRCKNEISQYGPGRIQSAVCNDSSSDKYKMVEN